VGRVTALAEGSAQVRATLLGVTGLTPVTVTPAALVSLAVSPAGATLPLGVATQLTATGTYTDGASIDLTSTALWTSSDVSVAVSSGVVRAVGLGQAIVTAAWQGCSAAVQVTASPARLDSITLAPLNASMAQATTRQLWATGHYSDGSTVDVTPLAGWSSSDGAVAAVSNAAGSKGLATGIAQGTVTVTALKDGVSAATSLTVLAGTLTAIDLIPSNPTAPKGTVRQLFAQATLSDGSTQDVTAQATWASDDETVATVSNAPGSRGLCTAVATGIAVVTATVGGVSGSTSLTVAPAALVSIALTPQNPSVAVDGAAALHAFGTYSDGSVIEITAAVLWSSSNPAIADVSNTAGSQGLVSGISGGSATITATLSSRSSSTPVSVTTP
jgi:hypothetical protein